MKLNVKNLTILKNSNPEKYHSLSAVMNLHVFLCPDSQLKGDIMDAIMTAKTVTCGTNAVVSNEPLHDWVSRIKLFVGACFKGHKNVVLFAGLTLQDAIYKLYTRESEPKIKATLFNEFETVEDAINDQRSKAENGEDIKEVHVILAECPQLSELQAAIKGEPQEAPEYAYTGCEVFINDEIYTMLEQCDKLIHADTVTN